MATSKDAKERAKRIAKFCDVRGNGVAHVKIKSLVKSPDFKASFKKLSGANLTQREQQA